MNNLEKVKLYLIKIGFDKDVVLNLPDVFIQDYLIKNYNMLSDLFDVFIDYVYKSTKYHDDYANFGDISCMQDKDMEVNKKGLYYSFKNIIVEEFQKYITREPLSSILAIGGNSKNTKDNNLFFNQRIVENPEQYSDLICLKPHFNIFDKSNNSIYFIKINDLSNLLLSKGLNIEDISMIMTEDKNGLYIASNAIKNLGAISKPEQQYFKK